jgi:hypothetical protein
MAARRSLRGPHLSVQFSLTEGRTFQTLKPGCAWPAGVEPLQLHPAAVLEGEQQALSGFIGAKLSGGQFHFTASILGKVVNFGKCSRAGAEAKAREVDSAQLLVHGFRAKTNMQWNTFTQADIAHVAELLRGKRVDVELAVVRAFNARRPWNGVNVAGEGWSTKLTCHKTADGKTIHLQWGGFKTAQQAADQADAGFLALLGLGATTNYPASLCSPAALATAAAYLIRMGVESARVDANVATVEQVRGLSLRLGLHQHRGLVLCASGRFCSPIS